MKRKHVRKKGVIFAGVIKNFTTEQLAGIGAVAMAYNDAEHKLHMVAGACLRYPGDAHVVVSRINGTDGLIGIINDAITRLNLPSATLKNIELALSCEGFPYLKTLRDGVIHARPIDMSSGVGRRAGRQGKYDDILLTTKAFTWLTTKLQILTEELEAIHTGIVCAERLTYGSVRGSRHKAQLEESIRASTALCQSHHTRRIALGPPPEFPEECTVLLWQEPQDPLAAKEHE